MIEGDSRQSTPLPNTQPPTITQQQSTTDYKELKKVIPEIKLEVEQRSPVSKRHHSFSIDNIMKRTPSLSPPAKRSKSDIFDSIPSPPPKLADIQSPHHIANSFHSPQLYNPFLLNIAAARNAVLPTNMRPPIHPLASGFLPVLSPFMPPASLPMSFPSGQHIL